jgi:hypothetical protein
VYPPFRALVGLSMLCRLLCGLALTVVFLVWREGRQRGPWPILLGLGWLAMAAGLVLGWTVPAVHDGPESQQDDLGSCCQGIAYAFWWTSMPFPGARRLRAH